MTDDDHAFALWLAEFWNIVGEPTSKRKRNQERFILRLAWDAGITLAGDRSRQLDEN